MPRNLTPDVRRLATANRALMESSDRPTLLANLQFLYDRFVWHPAPDVVAKFYPERLMVKDDA